MILQRVAALKKTTTKKLLCTSEAEGQIHHEEFNLHMEVRGGESGREICAVRERRYTWEN